MHFEKPFPYEQDMCYFGATQNHDGKVYVS